MTRRPNPSVTGYVCCICAAPASSYMHHDPKGMGGDPQGNRTDGSPACGTGGSPGNATCHDMQEAHHIETKRDDDGQLLYRAITSRGEAYLRGKGLPAVLGSWTEAMYEGKTWDEVG